MADPRVLEAQRWVNATYGGVATYVRCAEDGKTGWSTMYSLTRGLQHELGITALSDSFGPATMSRLDARGPIGPGYGYPNITRIIQHALYCKGYAAGETITGTYHLTTQAAVRKLMSDCGVVPSGTISAKWVKAILTMDAYVLVNGGTEQIRGIQQWLNARYVSRSTFMVGPCDGNYSRDVQVALMQGLQYEIGIPEAQVNGNFGPATQSGLRNHPIGPNTTGTWMQLFTAACVFNGPVPGADGVPVAPVFGASWTSGVGAWLRAFQQFSALPVNQGGDYTTWAQLLVSTGDPDREATACDTRFTIDAAKGAALYASGYRYIGRYLEAYNPEREKEIIPGEIEQIHAAGLRIFPIWQYLSTAPAYFTYANGRAEGMRAHDRAAGWGFGRGTTIYFSVDFDATDAQLDAYVLPYFRGVQAGLLARGRYYLAGVYGSRNVCARISAGANTRWSFVSGMSYGFSGNLGFPLPRNWSFNQIKEYRHLEGGKAIDLDRDVHRPNSDQGAGPEDMNDDTNRPLDAFLAYLDRIYPHAEARGGDPHKLVLDFLRYPKYVDFYDGWETLVGPVDMDWINHMESIIGAGRIKTFTDPAFGVTIQVDHLAATAVAEYLYPHGAGNAVTRGDFGGWAGDLCTFYGDWRNNVDQYPSGYDFCVDRLAKLNVRSSFQLGDLIEDVDGMLMGIRMRNYRERFTDALRDHLTGSGHLYRFSRFFGRFGGDTATVAAAARTLLTVVGPDPQLNGLRTAAIGVACGAGCLFPETLPDAELDQFLNGFADTITGLARP